MDATLETQLPNAVQWSEGMLLTPQHFQQNDIHWNAVLQHRLNGLSPHAWGLLTLELDLPELANRLVKIGKLNCIFPDGTCFVQGENYPHPLQLSITPEDTGGSEGEQVICAVMPPRTGALSVQSTLIRRFESVAGTAPVIDEMTGFADVYVDRVRPNVELRLKKNIPSGYQAIPLFSVRNKAGSFQLELTRYHPPMLRMGAAAFMPPQNNLLNDLKTLRDRMWNAMHGLTGLAQKDSAADEFGMSMSERAQLSTARHIASSLTMFDAIILDPETAPADAYRAFAHVVGSMAWIGSNPAPLAMEPYAHSDCIVQFGAAIDYVTRKLELINTVWEPLPFNRVGELGFLRRLPEDSSATALIEVRLRDGQNIDDVKHWLRDACIASDDLLPLLKRQRMSGAKSRLLGPAEIDMLGLRRGAIIVQVDSQKVEVANRGLVDCFRPGRGLLIQSSASHLLPAAVILQHAHAGAGA